LARGVLCFPALAQQVDFSFSFLFSFSALGCLLTIIGNTKTQRTKKLGRNEKKKKKKKKQTHVALFPTHENSFL
jgi:hypothetical protein